MRRQLPLLLLIAALGAVAWLGRDVWLPGAVESAGEREGEESSEAEPSPEAAAPEDPVEVKPLLRPAERPRLSPEEQAAREAAQRAAIEAAEKAGRVAFAGMLLDAAGRPVGYAKLVIAGREQALTVTTGADGTFDAQVKPGRYDLFVTAPGRGSAVLEGYVIDGASRLDLELKLQPPSTVTVVLERGGEGLAGAAIDLKHATWRWQGDAPVYRQTTDGAGRVTFPDLAQGLYDLTAVIPQGPVLRQPLEVKEDAEVRVVVPDAVELHGVVTEAGTQRGVAGAEVRITTALAKGPRLEVSITTQADGTFRFLVPQGSPMGVSVTATGFAPWPNPKEANRALAGLKGLASGKTGVTLDVTLVLGGAVAGRVTQDGTDTPIPGVTLAFRPRRGDVVRATSAEEGRYSVPNLNAGTYDVVVETAGWFPLKPLQVVVPAEAAAPVLFDVPLLGARSLAGVVVTQEGAKVGGARVWLTGGGQILRSARAAGRPLETFTSPDGRWSIVDVPPNLLVAVRGALGPLEALPVSVAPAPPAAGEVRLVLAGTGALYGRVTELGSGDPIANARVRVRPQGEPFGRDSRNVATDAEGRWRVEGLIPGDYELLPRRTPYLAATGRNVSLPAGTKEQHVDLTLDPGLVLAGFVTDAQGRALAGASLAAEGTAEDGSNLRRQGSSGPDGRFRLLGLARGLYRLQVSAAGFALQVIEGLVGGEDRMRIALTPAGS